MNPSPNDKILALTKLKAFADDKINVVQNIELALSLDRKHCWKRRKCWLPAFSSLPTMFSNGLFLGVIKIHDCLVSVK